VFGDDHELRRVRRLEPSVVSGDAVEPGPWLARYHALRLLRDAVMADWNPVSAAACAGADRGDPARGRA